MHEKFRDGGEGREKVKKMEGVDVGGKRGKESDRKG